jgi:hypothetical protein
MSKQLMLADSSARVVQEASVDVDSGSDPLIQNAETGSAEEGEIEITQVQSWELHAGLIGTGGI